MIVTVTMNPAIDKTVLVPGFRVGATNRATVDGITVGGKGINVARTLRRLGCEVLATGFLANDEGSGVATTLAQQGMTADFIQVHGETRVNLKVIDTLAATETEINEPGFAVPAAAIRALDDKLQALAARAEVMIFSGSLPPGAPADLYARFIALAKRAGVRTVLDTAGVALGQGIGAQPDLVKPNRAEAEELLGARLLDERDLLSAARRLMDLGASSVVLSLGTDGALSASPAGIWRSRLPDLPARRTVGAGDAMVAALAYGLLRELPPDEALHLATAASCAAATGAGPAPLLDEIAALLPQVTVTAVPLSTAATGVVPNVPS
jgi:1-phosphofructokinase